MLTNAIKTELEQNASQQLSWKNSVAAQKLLDTISQILAQEYCRIAKDNPEIFCQKGN